MTDHIARVREQAEKEADIQFPETPLAPENDDLAEAYTAGYMAAASRLTREKISEVLNSELDVCSGAFDEDDPCYKHRSYLLSLADAILALLTEEEQR